jgi:hypothetical protein
MKRAALHAAGTLAFLLAILCVHGQGARLYRLKQDQDVRTTDWRDSIYRFPEFRNGRVTFVAGRSPERKFNYNFFSGNMDFINDEGDTLELVNSREVRLVTIGRHVFYYDPAQGYIEIILQMPLSLGVKEVFFAAIKETVADDGYGVVSHTTSATRSFRGPVTAGVINVENLYKKEPHYFFIDQQNNLYQANKLSILRLFEDHKKEIKAYLKKNNVDFKNRQQMTDLVRFCNRFYQ